MKERLKSHKTFIGIFLLGLTALFLPILLLVSRDITKINSRAAVNNPAFLSRPSSAPIVKDGGNNVLIENVTIQGGSVNNPTGIGITIRNVHGTITIRDVDLANLIGGIYITKSSGTLIIENVRSRNIGNVTEANKDIGSGHGNHIQLGTSQFEGYIRNNKFLGGRTEDMVSTWRSGGYSPGRELIVEDNQFQGLVNDTSTARAWDSKSGTGIIISDGEGHTFNGNIIVRNNTFLTPGQVGIQHIDGPNIQTYGNIIYAQPRPQNNRPIASWEGNPIAEVYNNRYYWWSDESDSYVGPWYYGGGSINDYNNSQDSSINPADLEIDMNAGSSAPTPTIGVTPTNTPTQNPTLGTANCGTSLQTQVNSAASGGTLNVTGCTFNETVAISKPLTLVGGTIDGQNSRTVCLQVNNTNNVTIDGTRVINCNNPAQQGAIDVNNTNTVLISNATVTDCEGAGISVTEGSSVTIQDSEMARCKQEGYHGTRVGGTGYNLYRNKIHDNGGGYDPLWEAGGGKLTDTSGGVWEGNEVYNNKGPGLWCDIDCNDLIIRNNRVYDNTHSGIMYEISTNGLIEGNYLWRNGAGDSRGWGWPGSILVSVSQNVEVRNNIIAWSPVGISIIHQNRTDSPGPAKGNYVHDNTVISQGTAPLVGWFQDYSGTLFSDSTNRGENGKYWSSTPEPQYSRFEYSGVLSTLSAFNATRGEENGIYISSSEKDFILSASGMPACASCGIPTTSSTPTPTSSSGNPEGPSGYTFCATENHTDPEQCTFSGTRNVAYGRDGAFVYKIATNSITCNNVAFGSDPAVGQTKYCFYSNSIASPTLTSTPPSPTVTNTPTPSPVPNATILNFPTIKLHGIGSGGDNINPNLGGNPNPLRTTRDIVVELVDTEGNAVQAGSGEINFNNNTGIFSGNLEISSSIPTGFYLVKVKSPQYLKKQATGIINITKSQSNNIPEISLTTGDIDNDNALTIQDYNILIDCYSDLLPPKNCSDTSKKLSADISDDGEVNANDYNLFLRELSVASGD